MCCCAYVQYGNLNSFSDQQLADCDNIRYGYQNKGWLVLHIMCMHVHRHVVRNLTIKNVVVLLAMEDG